ncbi:hypothetical protein SAMN04487819_109177 [Actinopolyspora alba]|uniref:DUF6545 domain-containing protein n=1 Tax=Actinopolyspora alba TaxID=673379 RepID=A0A1I1YUY1_9ACTN|nr:MAB_1171c family putative transporter [Actinopolyspora alba]SFE21840.1 hypothetical protein SAMN04487819_109177 [Actinopolyspora alba]
MLAPNLLMWAAAVIAAAWKLSQLIRLPHDRGLRVVTLCTVLVAVALSTQLAVSIPGLAGMFPSQSPKLLQNVLLTFFFALLIVLLRSALLPNVAVWRSYVEIALASLASFGLMLAFAATSAEWRGASYPETSQHSGVLAFYLIGNLYMSYATARGAWLCRASARQTYSGARQSLTVAALGLTVCLLGTHLPRVLSTTGRLLLGTDPVPGTAHWTPPLLALGIGLFFLGIGYPGLRTGIIKARLWITMRRHHRQLRPLWAALYQHFPNIALFAPTTPRREAWQLRHMRLRYYRRIIECRDGLVCLSPYLPEPIHPNHTPAHQAQLVHTALTTTTRTQAALPSIIAAPTTHDTHADTHHLLALAHEYTQLANIHTSTTTA